VKRANSLLPIVCLVCLCGPVRSLHANGREWATVEDAVAVLDALANIQFGIPPALLKNAHGVAIIPNVFKASFVIGGRHGRGVLLVREPDGAWGRPVFVTLSGGGIGFQAGVQSTDLVLVFKTRGSLDRIKQGKITLGADVGVAAGPIGRQAEAATDAHLKAEIYSYSRSRGLFAGVSLEGAALLMDGWATQAYYRQEQAGMIDPRTGQPLANVVPPALRLQLRLTQLTAAADGPPVMAEPPLSGPPPLAPPLGPPLPVPQP
jgi:lipid-binding SYLF domain-containing protein